MSVSERDRRSQQPHAPACILSNWNLTHIQLHSVELNDKLNSTHSLRLLRFISRLQTTAQDQVMSSYTEINLCRLTANSTVLKRSREIVSNFSYANARQISKALYHRDLAQLNPEDPQRANAH